MRVVPPLNIGCIIEGDLLTQVQTHAMETLGPINWLYYRGWPAYRVYDDANYLASLL